MGISTMVKKILSYSLSIICIFLIWILAASVINSTLILPGPKTVLLSLLKIISTKKFWLAFLHTFLRVIIAFIISVLAGTLLGILCGTYEFARDFFEIPLSFMRTTPVIAIILVTMFWFNSKTVPVISALLMSLPIMTTSVTAGIIQSQDKYLLMSKSFRLSKKQVFLYIKLPFLKPHFISSMDSIFGLCWKVVAAGEVLSLPRYGIGTVMQTAQVHLETQTVMAVTIILVAVSCLLQKIAGLFK